MFFEIYKFGCYVLKKEKVGEICNSDWIILLEWFFKKDGNGLELFFGCIIYK